MDSNYEPDQERNGGEDERRELHQQNALTALILSIIGLAIFFLPVGNIAGLVLSIIGLTKSRTNRIYARENDLTESGQNSAAWICGLIGTILNAFTIIMMILALIALAGIAAYSFRFFQTVPGFSYGEAAVPDTLMNIFWIGGVKTYASLF